MNLITVEIHCVVRSSPPRLELVFHEGRDTRDAVWRFTREQHLRCFADTVAGLTDTEPLRMPFLGVPVVATGAADGTGQRPRADGPLWIPRLQVNVVDHCNMRCSHCAHSSPWLPKRVLAPEELARDLAALRGVVHAERLDILGGEPFLNPQLLELLAVAREHRVASEIRVVTNGQLLSRIGGAFWELADGLDVTVYPDGRYAVDPAAWLAAQPDEIKQRVVMRTGSASWYHWLALNGKLLDEPRAELVFRNCEDRYTDWMLRDGRLHTCAVGALLEDRLRARGTPGGPNVGGGVEIHGSADLRRDLERLFRIERHIPACAYCLGSSGPALEPLQLRSRREVEQEMTRDESAVVRATFAAFRDNSSIDCRGASPGRRSDDEREDG